MEPPCRAVSRVNNRNKKLQLELRARKMLRNESALSKAAREAYKGNAQAQQFLHEISQSDADSLT
jgi:hypothetical protein